MRLGSPFWREPVGAILAEGEPLVETTPHDRCEQAGLPPSALRDSRPVFPSQRWHPLTIPRQHRPRGRDETAEHGVHNRSWTRGWILVVVQFLKSGKWNAGERELASNLGIEWHAMGEDAMASPPAIPARVPNSAPERRSSPTWSQRRTARRVCSRAASTPAVGWLGPRREPVLSDSSRSITQQSLGYRGVTAESLEAALVTPHRFTCLNCCQGRDDERHTHCSSERPSRLAEEQP
jgi:hypothetical protein